METFLTKNGTRGMEPFFELERQEQNGMGWPFFYSERNGTERERNGRAEGLCSRTEMNDFKKVWPCPAPASSCGVDGPLNWEENEKKNDGMLVTHCRLKQCSDKQETKFLVPNNGPVNFAAEIEVRLVVITIENLAKHKKLSMFTDCNIWMFCLELNWFFFIPVESHVATYWICMYTRFSGMSCF